MTFPRDLNSGKACRSPPWAGLLAGDTAEYSMALSAISHGLRSLEVNIRVSNLIRRRLRSPHLIGGGSSAYSETGISDLPSVAVVQR